MVSWTIGLALLLADGGGDPALTIRAGELRVLWGEAATPPERRAAELFAAEA